MTSLDAELSSHARRDELYRASVIQRRQGRFDEALRTLAELEHMSPAFSRLHEERGLCRAMAGDVAGAIDACSRAVAINPALATSWAALERLFRESGNDEAARNAARQREQLAAMPAAIVLAGSFFSDGDLPGAERVLREALEAGPPWTAAERSEAMRLLGRIAHIRGRLHEAEAHLTQAVEGAPRYLAARLDLIRVTIELQRYAAALVRTEAMLAMWPRHEEGRALHATVLAALGRHRDAVGAYLALLAQSPQTPHLHVLLGHSLRAEGDRDGAVRAYRAAIARRAEFGDAWWSLANLKTYRFTHDDIDAMRAAEVSADASASDRAHLSFALGKAYEDASDFAQAWTCYERGNALKRAEAPYRPEIIETNTREQKRVCTASFFAQRSGWGTHDAAPIFIVGLPRSGSTLVEQILGAHSQVEGTHELFDITRFVLELQGTGSDPLHPRYPAVLGELDRETFARLGRRYLDDTHQYRAGRAFFIDKMPNNFRHIGLIHLTLPRARIIDVRRDPLGCCFSNLKQLYARGQEFSYGIDDIARYYRTYLDLMEHWDAVLPGRVLRVFYEDLVDDLEGGVRAVLAHCGLDFEAGCVDFHRSTRAVTTASSEQVRRPIFRDGLSQWRHFEPWLGPLKDALGDATTRYRTRPADV